MNFVSNQMTLREMVEVIDKSETEEVDLNLIQAVIKALPSKVDGCAQYLDSLDDEITRAKDYSKKFSELAKQIEARKERFEGYLKHSIESNNFEKLTGDAFQMTIKKNPASVITRREADAADSLNYPNLVTTKMTHPDQCEVVDSFKLTQATAMRVLEPHQVVVNHDNFPRISCTVAFKQDLNHLLE